MSDNKLATKSDLQEMYNRIYPYLGGLTTAKAGFTPIGTIISVMGTTAPVNYLACDGTVYNIADYTELANYFNEQFGSKNFFGGDGTTTFAVPDLRGEFLRGTGTNSHENQGSGASVGVHQDGTEHIRWQATTDGKSFGVRKSSNSVGEQIKNEDSENTLTTGASQCSMSYSASAYSQVKGVYYTSRPTNTSVLYCIATKNFYIDPTLDYSLDEKVVGTWITGEPIYQKTFDLATPISITANNWTNVNASFSGADRIVLCYGYNSNGVIPLYSNPRSDADGFVVYSYVSLSSVSKFTIQYTKTTTT